MTEVRDVEQGHKTSHNPIVTDEKDRRVNDSTILPTFNKSDANRGREDSSQELNLKEKDGSEPDHQTTEGPITDEAPSKYPSVGELMHRYRAVVHLGLVLLLLGWWIPGLILDRKKWVPNTIICWFFIGLIFFQWCPTEVFSKPIGATWDACVSNPWFKLTYYTRLAIGWVCLLALILGSAFGVPLQPGTELKDRAISVFGLFVFQFCLWLSCAHKKFIAWRTVIVGLGMQQILALFVLKTGAGFSLFSWIAAAATDLLNQGTNAAGFFWSAEFLTNHYFFINVLSAIIFFLAFVQLLYYLGVMQWVLYKFAWFFFNVMGVSGAEAVVAAASPFIGQGESAALVKPFVAHMTPAELHQAMASGFATISGSVLGAYVSLGMPAVYLVSSSVMSIPASLAISKLRFPETGTPLTAGKVTLVKDNDGASSPLHAFSNGAWFGLHVAGMILANILTILGLLYTVDGVLTYIGRSWGLEPGSEHALTLELIFQYLFYPVAWLMGTPKSDIMTVSRLLGIKLISNEFVAYTQLSTIKETMTPRGFVIATYSLCGFANISSLGIQIGVLGSMAPSRKSTIAKVAVSALFCGFLSTVQTAGIAGMLL